MNVLDGIGQRRSVRSFAKVQIARNKIDAILEAGTLAPSGKNGQPWRFFVVQREKDLLRRIAEQTVYHAWVSEADCLILVFLDREKSYHEIKDAQATGACMENMLLAAEELGIGACWNGEILRNAEEVRNMCSLAERYQLMALLVLGYAKEKPQERMPRLPLPEVVLSWIRAQSSSSSAQWIGSPKGARALSLRTGFPRSGTPTSS